MEQNTAHDDTCYRAINTLNRPCPCNIMNGLLKQINSDWSNLALVLHYIASEAKLT
jgi:hypothetical protein